MKTQHVRSGFTLLELQVAFVIFTIAMAGLCPLVVMQSKHLKQIEGRFSDDVTYYVIPSTDDWARKLGAGASIETEDPGSPAADPVLIIDNDDSGFSTTGTAWTLQTDASAFQGDYYQQNAGDGSAVASWQFTGLAPGWYDVRVTWVKKKKYASNAPFAVYDGLDSEGTILVDQAATPSGETYSGVPWESLGTFLITSDTLKVELSDDADGKVIADGVRLVEVQNTVQINSLDKSLSSETATAHVSVTVLVPE